MSEGWVEVTLLTMFGDKVARVKVPNYKPPPEVIIWGGRYFVRHDGRYVEGLAVSGIPVDSSSRKSKPSLVEKWVSAYERMSGDRLNEEI